MFHGGFMGRKKKEFIIPDVLFHRLWSESLNCITFNNYKKQLSISDFGAYFHFEKMGFDYDLYDKTLLSIYRYSNMEFAELIKEVDLSPANLAHRFCIPIDTVKGWLSTGVRKRKVPAYIKFMIINICGITFLPDNVYIQGFYNNQRIRRTHKPSKNKFEQTPTNNQHQYENQFMSMREWEQLHVSNQDNDFNSDFLEKTAYLSAENRKYRKNIRVDLDI